MAIKIEVKGIKGEIARQRKERNKIAKREVYKKGVLMRADLAAATPVDTGEARAGWKLIPFGDKVIIKNDVPHINKLNEGTSKQAPEFFVERVALKYGRPFGLITRKTD